MPEIPELPKISNTLSKDELIARYERALREQRRNLEAIHDEAYRAGREDAARGILDHPGPDPSPASPAWWAGYTEAQKDAAKIARGDGIQPTEEQRRPDEDQKRGEGGCAPGCDWPIGSHSKNCRTGEQEQQ